MKTDIIKWTGEFNLLLPQLIQKGLSAGDKSRYYLNLLLSGIEHANNYENKWDSLADLRVRVGIKNEKLDSVISDSSLSSEGVYCIPFFDEIQSYLSRTINIMVFPFRQETVYSNPDIVARAESLISTFCGNNNPLTCDDPRINLLHEEYPEDNFISLIRSIEEKLIPIQEKMIPEDVYGSIAYLVEPEDIYLVRSFMIGLNRTESLRCEHPGLGTKVIRAGKTLLIQNEIGMTDSNFLLLNITGLDISIQYIDSHISRITFFQSLMHPYPVFWREVIFRTNEGHNKTRHIHIAFGVFNARSREELMVFLSHLSSHIVFLIEWNRARKALRPFLPGNEVMKVLQKAVRREVGHRAFLLAGGDQLIYDVLNSVPEISLKYGDTLSDLIGNENAVEFCISVLEISNRYVTQNLPRLHLREDIRAELLRQYTIDRENIHQLFISYAGKIKRIIFLFSSLSSMLMDSNFSQRNRIELQIQECSVQIDVDIKDIRAKIIRKNPDGPWVLCFSQINKAIEVLGETGYLYTLIPHTGMDPDIAREIRQLSEYSECIADFLYQAIEEGEETPSWSETYHKDMKRYDATVTQIIIASDEIVRSAHRRKYLVKNSGNEQHIAYDICKHLKEVLNLLISGTESLKGDNWYHQIRPHLRFCFSHNLSIPGERKTNT